MRAPPKEILELIERFERNREAYHSGRYKETQLRREFIDPFFEVLGWDVYNKKGYAEPYKDVIHEDAIKVGSVTKAPDYCFRIGGSRKFFLEAKKPSVNLKDDTAPAFQLRRYAWSSKLPLSILTDFEEFAVYDCRTKPVKTDKTSTARVMYMTYRDYSTRWDEIASIFSREAILKGSFDKYVEKEKRGTAEVDSVFLSEIESWRDALARNIALRNPSLTQRELNFAVQATIDRVIFLRICEDRGIEGPGRLLALTAGPKIYPRLCQLFRDADDRYNSGLFHFREEKDRSEPPDDLTLALKIDDKVLKDITKELYYPESPYEFAYLPADILGQVYEQFLGKVIRLTPGHRAVIEDKPEVKKAGGVYYTPTYIVDYIVENTIGKLLKGKKPSQVANLRILDPACGSGSFLIAAYQYLLDWHRDWYVDDDPKKHKKKLYQTEGGGWKLTTTEKKRILLNNIYGVDIDSQAVEVTKLSLLLKVLEEETQLTLFHERALPDLGSNIKCGNSLISPDFYQGQQMRLLDEEERYRINAFDWDAEFPEIMQSGGFNAVIGNPPYLRIQGLQEFYGNQIEYFSKHFQSAVKRFDLYLLFIEKGFKLLRVNGFLGFICPNKFFNSDFGSGLRDFLISNTAVNSVISFGNNLVFSTSSTYTGVLILSKNRNDSFSYYKFQDMPNSTISSHLFSLKPEDFTLYNISNFTSAPWVLTHSTAGKVLARMEQPLTLGDIFEEILVGVQSGIDDVHVLKFVSKISNDVLRLFSQRANSEVDLEARLVKPLLTGEDVHRYSHTTYSHYCIYPYRLENEKTKIIEEQELKKTLPLGYAYLSRYRKDLTEIRIRQKTNPVYWYSCHRSRDMRVFEAERIITPEISFGCNMTIVRGGLYHNTQVYSLLPKESLPGSKLYWLGLLNSKLMWYFLRNTGTVLRGGYIRFKTEYLKPFPARSIDFSDPTDKAHHDRMVELVESMFSLHKQLAAVKTAHDKITIQRQITATDNQIDQLVYELYGLTEKDIRIIEKDGKTAI